MSLYHHSPGYGQAAYPGNGYAYPPPPPVHYSGGPPVYPPVPAPVYFADPSSFRRDYASRLQELTINSRPIIQSLSMIAQDYVRYADIVAQCLEAHIRRVPPWMKLPAFYLLDAISKNVFDPYASKFSAFVVPLFLETYGQVDPSTRSKMEEMLVTWRNGSPSGKELFGVATQVTIERSIWGSNQASTIEPPPRRGQASSHITRSQVLAELEVTLAQKERACQSNPYDTVAQNQVNVLHQLRKLVEVGVSQEELSQILGQLRAMSRDTAMAPPPPPPPPPQQQQQLSAPSVYPPSAPPTDQAFVPVHVPAPIVPPAPYRDVSQPSALIDSVPATTVSGSNNISNLFQSLVKAGLVTANNTPTGAGRSTQSLEESKPSSAVNAVDTSAKDYTKSILSMKVRLTSADISKQRPQNIRYLYEKLPVQCRQCAIRFTEDAAGKKSMEEHLDMHFRQNRRASMAAGRGHSRSWFVDVENWINDLGDDPKGKARAAHQSGDGKTISSTENAERDASLRAAIVVVPPGDEVKNIRCPICKEVLKSEFMDDEEEWVWRNAIRVKDKICHATCHAEMLGSSTLAAKLRGESSNSRGATPEIEAARPATPVKDLLTTSLTAKLRASRSPSPDRVRVLAGSKRKATDSDINELSEQISVKRTPPSVRATAIS